MSPTFQVNLVYSNKPSYLEWSFWIARRYVRYSCTTFFNYLLFWNTVPHASFEYTPQKQRNYQTFKKYMKFMQKKARKRGVLAMRQCASSAKQGALGTHIEVNSNKITCRCSINRVFAYGVLNRKWAFRWGAQHSTVWSWLQVKEGCSVHGGFG